jgi:hypothetical protein
MYSIVDVLVSQMHCQGTQQIVANVSTNYSEL